MPSRYIEKQYAEETHYHIFNRGVEKRDIFLDDSDFKYFLMLLKRYLSFDAEKDTKNRELPSYRTQIDLVAYCLMPNHFHMLIYQKTNTGMENLMRSLSTSYSMYFNKKYKRVGKLFQSRYKAVLIEEEGYWAHISRYIHLNPLDIGRNYESYEYSSMRAWLDPRDCPEWLNPGEVRASFNSSADYSTFVADYVNAKTELDHIKASLKE